jgi:predicted dehydrogenase
MYSVGILSAGVEWPEILSGLLGESGWRVSGRIDPAEAGRQAAGDRIDRSDLVWIPQKINGSMEDAIQVIRHSRHLSLGFPIVDFEEEASTMVKLAHEARVLVQVGHRDWFRPVVRSALGHIRHPQSICFDEHVSGENGEDPGSLFTLMVADVDLALGLSGSTVRKVRSHASRLIDGTVIGMDIRMEMHNGSVIILNVRKYSTAPRRRVEIIQADGVIRLDLTSESGTMERIEGDEAGKVVNIQPFWPPAGEGAPFGPNGSGEDWIARQCVGFVRALERGRHPLSGLEGGYKALEMARHIQSILHTF